LVTIYNIFRKICIYYLLNVPVLSYNYNHRYSREAFVLGKLEFLQFFKIFFVIMPWHN